ncbi:hypothetical protein HYPSUDRAFT_207820 [Hypholoma sublateritium FD-334 SS-4]|uniref:Uncharacterized protein n=1 Tax=Hypholoma sublateritium (strain FD-334 SS-4) TaxID=945553 RepID=A0A0D2LX71_HYPSF|nr:hypothetical protein HYPSUDRAFT_207820 [Hypholoma sublateritium FD-334 SS-4]
MMASKLLLNMMAAKGPSSSYEFFLPRGVLSKRKSLPKRQNAIQVFRDAIEKMHTQISANFDGPRKWAVVINQPCLHNSDNRLKNRYRARRLTPVNSQTDANHYTAYGYLATTSACSQSMKGGCALRNRWWMHVDAAKRVDYAPYFRGGKMWKRRLFEKEIVPLAGPFEI